MKKNKTCVIYMFFNVMIGKQNIFFKLTFVENLFCDGHHIYCFISSFFNTMKKPYFHFIPVESEVQLGK